MPSAEAGEDFILEGSVSCGVMPFPWLPRLASVTKPVLQRTTPDYFWWPKPVSSGQRRHGHMLECPWGCSGHSEVQCTGESPARAASPLTSLQSCPPLLQRDPGCTLCFPSLTTKSQTTAEPGNGPWEEALGCLSESSLWLGGWFPTACTVAKSEKRQVRKWPLFG